jgi:hypothetical protein
MLPQQRLPNLVQVPEVTVLSLLLMAAPVAGTVEEAAFRGYMQGPIERRYGLTVAILVTGTMFAVAHLDFTLILWPYYVAVTAIYGTVTYLTESILPAVVQPKQACQDDEGCGDEQEQNQMRHPRGRRRIGQPEGWYQHQSRQDEASANTPLGPRQRFG